jgi:uncharacterized protein (TIGR02246 family)
MTSHEQFPSMAPTGATPSPGRRVSRRLAAAILLGIAAAIATGYQVSAQLPGAAAPAAAPAVAPTQDADRDAIVKMGREFAEAFNRGDAKAVGAFYTESAETREVGGPTVIGRAAIEKAYTEFFKENPGAKIEVLVRSVRFPAKDMAIEEGLLRQWNGPQDLPASTNYVAVHAREGGQWRVALSSEGGPGQDRLEDLDWVLGEWTTKTKNGTVTFAFVRDPKKAVITGTFTRTPTGKEPITGTIRIAHDPETGGIRSWGFEDDGAHASSIWSCDGKAWILDQRGVLADGTPVAERLLLQRVAPDAITWRAIDRVRGDEQLPDTTPMRLTRTAAPK